MYSNYGVQAITMAALSDERIIFAPSNTRVVRSNSARDMDVCVCFVLSCV
jgi:hypothetical protein